MKSEFLYKKVFKGIKDDIKKGRFPEGSRLPSEEEFCKEYDVSTITVKKAMDLLALEGFIRRVPGRGTYVLNEEEGEEVRKNNEDIEYEHLDNSKLSNHSQSVQKHKKSRMIGIVFEHVASPFGLDMMYQLDREAEKAGYKLCIRFSYGNREKETEEIEHLLSLNVEGFIIMPCHGAHYNTAILKLIIDKFPVVLIDKKMIGISVSSVSTDGRGAIRGLVQHLYDRGCRKIGLITVDTTGTTSLIDRRKGFYDGIEELHLPTFEECVLNHDNTDFVDPEVQQQDTVLIRKYLEKRMGKLDGIVCSEYGMMKSVVQAAKELNIKFGSDLKVCCIDEDYQASEGYYFTHMKQDERAIAKLAFKLLLQDDRQPAVDYVVPAIFRQGKTT